MQYDHKLKQLRPVTCLRRSTAVAHQSQLSAAQGVTMRDKAEIAKISLAHEARARSEGQLGQQWDRRICLMSIGRGVSSQVVILLYFWTNIQR